MPFKDFNLMPGTMGVEASQNSAEILDAGNLSGGLSLSIQLRQGVGDAAAPLLQEESSHGVVASQGSFLSGGSGGGGRSFLLFFFFFWGGGGGEGMLVA